MPLTDDLGTINVHKKPATVKPNNTRNKATKSTSALSVAGGEGGGNVASEGSNHYSMTAKISIIFSSLFVLVDERGGLYHSPRDVTPHFCNAHVVPQSAFV